MNESIAPQNGSTKQGIFYALWLMIAWTLYVGLVYPFLGTEKTFFTFVVKELMRVLIFLGPIYFLTRNWQPSQLMALGILNTNWLRGLLWGALVGIAWGAFMMMLNLTVAGRAYQPDAFGKAVLAGFSMAVLVEEFTFRSYLLQSCLSRGKWFAVLISALLFVLIHYPGWSMLGMKTSFNEYLNDSVIIFCLGCALGYLYLKTKNVWACLLLHACHNMAVVLTLPH